jgi:hypothetical protein
MALGVPGPTGATGATGATGQGVAAGGTTGQALVKLSGTNYDTGWASINSAAWGNITGTLSSQTDLQNALNAKLSTSAAASTYLPLTGGTMSGDLTIARGANVANFNITGDGGKSLEFGSDTYFKLTSSDINLTFDGAGLSLNGAGNYLYFADGSAQTTAFPPSGGTTSQYIRGDGSLYTFPAVGDRYLTSSTSTLTCDSGNGKTMTIGTGLSYSRQQDITVSYSNSIHMHGTVLTYDSATGVMTFDANTHSGSGTFSNWQVNVGGVAGAILPVGGTAGQVLAKINSTNFNTEWISLGSMATQSTSAFLSTASAVANYLTISDAASTYLTQSSASSTYIAQASFATSTQAQAGTSTTTVVSPATLLDAKYFSGGKSAVQITWSTGTSGTGASAGAQNANGRLNAAPTTAVGYAIAGANLVNTSRGLAYGAPVDFSKRVQLGLRVARNVASPDSASVWRYSIGKSIGVTSAGDLSVRGLMIKVAGSGALQLLVHNGTSLTAVTSSYTPSNSTAYDVVVVSDGAGNVTLYVNGSSVATSTGGPTSSSGGSPQLTFEVENTAIITGSPQNICISDYYLNVNV